MIRPAVSSVSLPLATREVIPHWEALSEPMVWEIILTITNSRRAGTRHFASVSSATAGLLEEFRSYIRQAKVYFDGAQATVGTSASLLYYYCALNLAKAELLTSSPTKVTGKIKHGLWHDISNAGNPRKDFVTVRNGVFPLLYQKRTGMQIPDGTRLRIPDLLTRVPEIGLELGGATGLRCTVASIWHALLWDNAGNYWTAILTGPSTFLTNKREPVTRRLLAAFEPVSPLVPEWKQLFGLSGRAFLAGASMYQSRRMLSGFLLESAMQQVAPFSMYLDNPHTDQVDALLAPALPGSSLPLTPDIARYVLMFYLSSLVRYRPSILDPRKFPDFTWAFESFCRMAALPLVANAGDAIADKWSLFGTNYRS